MNPREEATINDAAPEEAKPSLSPSALFPHRESEPSPRSKQVGRQQRMHAACRRFSCDVTDRPAAPQYRRQRRLEKKRKKTRMAAVVVSFGKGHDEGCEKNLAEGTGASSSAPEVSRVRVSCSAAEKKKNIRTRRVSTSLFLFRTCIPRPFLLQGAETYMPGRPGKVPRNIWQRRPRDPLQELPFDTWLK